MPGSSPTRAMDDLMERASVAMAAADYFEAEALCLRAMAKARAGRNFELMARVSMPLQESRRQRRHDAIDSGHVAVLRELPLGRGAMRAGCYLIEPPLIGLDARAVRELLTRRRVPALVLAREPMTAKGQWPIVGVGIGEPRPVVVRAYVDPPEGSPSAGLLLAAQERLGDAAIAKVGDVPIDHRVDDLWEYLAAVPDHEKLAQAFEAACRGAARAGVDSGPRRRGFDLPYSF